MTGAYTGRAPLFAMKSRRTGMRPTPSTPCSIASMACSRHANRSKRLPMAMIQCLASSTTGEKRFAALHPHMRSISWSLGDRSWIGSYWSWCESMSSAERILRLRRTERAGLGLSWRGLLLRDAVAQISRLLARPSEGFAVIGPDQSRCGLRPLGAELRFSAHRRVSVGERPSGNISLYILAKRVRQ